MLLWLLYIQCWSCNIQSYYIQICCAFWNTYYRRKKKWQVYIVCLAYVQELRCICKCLYTVHVQLFKYTVKCQSVCVCVCIIICPNLCLRVVNSKHNSSSNLIGDHYSFFAFNYTTYSLCNKSYMQAWTNFIQHRADCFLSKCFLSGLSWKPTWPWSSYRSVCRIRGVFCWGCKMSGPLNRKSSTAIQTRLTLFQSWISFSRGGNLSDYQQDW